MQTETQRLIVDGYHGASAGTTATLVTGLTSTLVVQAVDENGDPAPPANLENVASWKFVLAADWDPATAPCFATDSVAYDAATATWTISLYGSRTTAMVLALGKSASIRIGCEIVGLTESGDWAHPAYVLQFVCTMRNRRDSDATPPSDVEGETQVHDLRVTGCVQTAGGVDVLDPSARYLLGDWFARFGTFEAESLRAISFRLYDSGVGAWRTVSLYNGQLVVGDPEQ